MRQGKIGLDDMEIAMDDSTMNQVGFACFDDETAKSKGEILMLKDDLVEVSKVPSCIDQNNTQCIKLAPE